MARFLFCVRPTRGHVYPSLPIAHALRAAGHAVAYLTIPQFRHLLAPYNIALFPLAEHAHFPLEDHTAGTGPRPRPVADRGEGYPAEGGTAGATKAAFRAAFVDTVPACVRSLQQATAAWQPDVLINDYVSYAPLIVAELEQRPLATLNMTVALWPGEDLAPFGPGLPPARDAATRAHYAHLRARAEAPFADVMAGLNAVRDGYGLPAHRGPFATAALSPDLLLLLGIPELDYHRADLPPHAHYVGPCAWDPPLPLDPATAAWLATLPASLPLALVSASTATRPVDRRSAALVEAALAGLAEGGVAVLATLPFEHPLHHAPTPPGTHLVRFVPHSRILPRAAVVVTHGGFGTVSKALGAGLPLVVVPYAAEQPEVAQRVVAAGAGLRLDAATLTPAALGAAVAAVLGEGRYRAGAQRLAAALARRDGPGHAAALLARLAGERTPLWRPASRAAVGSGLL